MQDIRKLKNIRSILGNWNPLNVPEFIKEEEYKSYALEILKKYKTKEDIQMYLTSIFINDMGYELIEAASLDIKDASAKIAKVLKGE